MIDVYYEESSKVQNPKRCKAFYITFTVLSIVTFFFAAVWLLAYINSLTTEQIKQYVVHFIMFVILPFLLLVGAGIFFWFMRKKTYVEYDYTFISGTIKIARVIMNKIRKPLIKFGHKDVEKIGRVDSQTYEKYLSMQNVKKYFYSANKVAEEGKELYYIIARENKLRNIIIIETTQEFLVNVVKYTGRMVLEKDFK